MCKYVHFICVYIQLNTFRHLWIFVAFDHVWSYYIPLGPQCTAPLCNALHHWLYHWHPLTIPPQCAGPFSNALRLHYTTPHRTATAPRCPAQHRTTTHCTSLHCTAVHHTVLIRFDPFCNTPHYGLHSVTPHQSTPHCTSVHHTAPHSLQCAALHCAAV